MARKIKRSKEGLANRQALRPLDIPSINKVRQEVLGKAPLPKEAFYCKTKKCGRLLTLEAFIQGDHCWKCIQQKEWDQFNEDRFGLFDGKKPKKGKN